MPRRKLGQNAQPEAAGGLQRMWVPWRSRLSGRGGNAKPGAASFVSAPRAQGQARTADLHAGPRAVVMLNRYPYSSGHLLVAPRSHAASPELLDRDERIPSQNWSRSQPRICVRPIGRPESIIGANLGRAAGASFDDHMHWHLVPRWDGDTNFMTVLVSTRVLAQPLAETYALLEPLFKAIDPAAILTRKEFRFGVSTWIRACSS